MNFAIIAAGEGARLAHEGVDSPKPLVRLGGQAMVERLVRIFLRQGASRVVVIINDRVEETRLFLQSLQETLPIELVVKTTPSSMHSFHEISHLLGKEPFCLTTVDTIFREEEFARYIRAFRNSTADGLMAVTDYVDDEKPLYISTDRDAEMAASLVPSDTDREGAVSPSQSPSGVHREGAFPPSQSPSGADREGAFPPSQNPSGVHREGAFPPSQSPSVADHTLRITGFHDQPTPHCRYISGGIYCLTPKALETLHRCIAQGQSRMRNFQRQLVADGLRLEAWPFSKILDVDHASDIAKAELFLRGEGCL